MLRLRFIVIVPTIIQVANGMNFQSVSFFFFHSFSSKSYYWILRCEHKKHEQKSETKTRRKKRR